MISEPSKMRIDHFFEYHPKKIHDQTNAISLIFVADNSTGNPGLTTGHVTIKWILMRCNIALDNRGDIEEHTAHTHGININQLEREVSIKKRHRSTHSFQSHKY